MILLGQLLTKRGSYHEAEALLQEALLLRQAQYGLGHRTTVETLRALVTLYDLCKGAYGPTCYAKPDPASERED